MKLLLDTHVIIWALTDDPRLSAKARELVVAPGNLIYYSAASLWEIAIKNQKAPEKCPYREDDVSNFCEQAGFLPLNVQPRHILEIRGLRVKEGRYLGNQDPFDRILLAQAKAEDCTFLSHDRNFDHYDEKCICLI